MYLFSIMNLDSEHIEEICEDIREQYETGVSNCALFKMTLVPEGDPVIPKAEQLCAVFDQFRDRLSEMGIPCGILMQASIGHGYPLNRKFPFQRYTNMTNDEEQDTVCPYDENFRDYIRHTMQVLASHKPTCIMVDDDFRMLNARPGHGCACPLHMKAVETATKKTLTREQLKAHIYGETAEDAMVRDAFVRTQIESLVDCAKVMREGIDSVDPTLPGMFCCVGNACEGAVDIATALAGKGNPVIVRINNGNYHPAGARYLSSAFMRAAVQIVVLRGQGRVDSFLAETDTCPQNRYSTGAMSLHSHFTGTILEGASGAKHWITRLGNHEPNSGVAYRKTLAKYRGFYEALSEIVPTLTWRGCRMPLSTEPDYGFRECCSLNAWTTHVLERMGLPVFFSENTSKVAFLEGEGHSLFSDEQITNLLRHTLVLDGGAAERLCQRGFAELLGVTATPFSEKIVSGEQFLTESGICNAQVKARCLHPIDDTVCADTLCYHVVDGVTKEPLFPGSTVYHNKLGGTAIVFGGNAQTEFHYLQAFSFLNETRKRQLIRLLRAHGDLPLYYTGDAEVYLRAADMSDGGRFCAFFNIGMDPIEEITLWSDTVPVSVERLAPDGSRVPCSFTVANGVITVGTPAYTLQPVVLFLK